MLSDSHMVTTSGERKKSKMRVSIDWYVAIEHQRLGSIRVSLLIIRLVNYSVTTSLIYKYII